VQIDAVDLSDLPPDAPLDPSHLDDANVPSLLNSPMCTYHVRGSTNRLLLQGLRLHALVKSKVERARQWQRTFKELAANTTGKPLIDEEQVNPTHTLASNSKIATDVEFSTPPVHTSHLPLTSRIVCCCCS
jgi:hypothetical protein